MSDAYKKAGVDLKAGYAAVEKIKQHVNRTWRPEVLSGLGGFGGLFELPKKHYNNPVLVAGTDGVGTKLKIAFALKQHDTIGIDLVAMCVNDVVVQGAEPLFFLDYLATSKLDPNQVEQVVSGISEGCIQAGCALIGGETAEMPGMYNMGEYDLAGFCVGIVEKKKLITGAKITPGDVILGLPSSGLHSNGFSLVRQLLPVSSELIEPTRIYVQPILKLVENFEIAGMAHITGGGFIENIPRILPDDCKAEINIGSWPVMPIFEQLRAKGVLNRNDMYSTFNMGIGLIMVVKQADVKPIIQFMQNEKEAVYTIGKIMQGKCGISFKEDK